MDGTVIAQVERQCTELEEHINKLRKSLQHWQTWEIEYEGLREEIAGLPDGSDANDVLAIAREFRAELVDDKELHTIIGKEGRSVRNQAQIVDLLAKRVEYVSRNARTIEKQLSDAQKKRNALLVAEEPDYREDAGLPLTDITEELDDEGNIVSRKLGTPGSTAPQLADILKKAGVKDLEQGSVNEGRYDSWREEESPTETASNVGEAMKQDAAAHECSTRSQSEEQKKPDKDFGGRKRPNGEHRSPPISPKTDTLALSKVISAQASATQVSIDSKSASDKTGGGGEEAVATTYHQDTPEEAELRDEMLQYGLDEVGAIVAELDLAGSESDTSYNKDTAAISFGSDFDGDDTEDEAESEDENGMAKHPILSRRYVEKMKELEEKHGIKGMQNLGPDASKLPKEVQVELQRPAAAEAARKAALARQAMSKDSSRLALRPKEQDSAKPRRKVAFAEDLNIAPETGLFTPVHKASKGRPEELELGESINDSVVGRRSSTVSSHTTQSSGQARERKPSKFKAAREAMPQTPLLPPSPTSLLTPQAPIDKPKSMPPRNKILADSIVEHDIKTKPNLPDSDGLDEATHRQEIAGEYYKLRNRMIQRQGGFVGEGAAENYGEAISPLPVIDEDGREKKISRFRAARLR